MKINEWNELLYFGKIMNEYSRRFVAPSTSESPSELMYEISAPEKLICAHFESSIIKNVASSIVLFTERVKYSDNAADPL